MFVILWVCDTQLLVHLACPGTGAVELRNELARAMGIDLPSTLVYDYPTVTAMVDYVVRISEQKLKRPLSPTPIRQIFTPITPQLFSFSGFMRGETVLVNAKTSSHK
jgi:Phosphopantetheine attachment site